MTPLLPAAFSRFEQHLGRPAKIHNIRKRMAADKEWVPPPLANGDGGEDPIHAYAKDRHLFAEGPDLLLSDVLLHAHFLAASEALGSKWEDILGRADSGQGRMARWGETFEVYSRIERAFLT